MKIKTVSEKYQCERCYDTRAEYKVIHGKLDAYGVEDNEYSCGDCLSERERSEIFDAEEE